VITGVSGSGKSSLAFDTLYAEGQRRYIESMSSYARQFLERMERPDVDYISGMLPAIAIESKNVITNARSTVGTQTELHDFLRLLFARVGRTFCRSCGHRVRRQSTDEVAEDILRRFDGRPTLMMFEIPLSAKAKKYLKEARSELLKQGYSRVYIDGAVHDLEGITLKTLRHKDRLTVVVDRLTVKGSIKGRLIDSLETAYDQGRGSLLVGSKGEEKRYSEKFHCSVCDLVHTEPTPNIFSFNNPLGACATCQGFGRIIIIDPELVIPDPQKSLAGGAVEPWTKPSTQWQFYQLKKVCQKKRIPFTRPWNKLTERQQKLIFDGGEGYFGINDYFAYLEKKKYKMHVRVFLSHYRSYVPCTACRGLRLKPDALSVRVGEKNIAELSAMTIGELRSFFSNLTLSPHEEETAGTVRSEIQNRIEFLDDVGLDYLTLDRTSRTLSGGEAQRIHLTTSLGSALVDTLYVLDEPSIGLHERDNQLLIQLLKRLRDLGNTVVVVEHDKTMITSADQVIDLGPRAGQHGGRLIFQGSVESLLKEEHSLTAAYLSGRETIAIRQNGRTAAGSAHAVVIEGASEHNLKGVRISIPIGKFCVLTGVSGSGKSTLLYDVLYKNYLRYRGKPVKERGSVKRILGFEYFDDMVLIDQSPIGRTPRSNPATYAGVFDDIRQIFARTREARLKRMRPGIFSFNVDGGRCPKCKGDGKIKVEMHFLADIFIECDQCNGTRYQEHVLNVFYRGKNVHQVLALTIDEGLNFFRDQRGVTEKLKVLAGVGLGYLRLGQAANTLSSGEAQRLKLGIELLQRPDHRMFYLFDEPTTGLHYDDIRYLMNAFERLLEAGHSILVIEHNMEVIKCADWIIDLGPEGGEKGGHVVGCGTPAVIAELKASHTGRYLKRHLEDRKKSCKQ